jgi:hypothetical protein
MTSVRAPNPRVAAVRPPSRGAARRLRRGTAAAPGGHGIRQLKKLQTRVASKSLGASQGRRTDGTQRRRSPSARSIPKDGSREAGRLPVAERQARQPHLFSAVPVGGRHPGDPKASSRSASAGARCLGRQPARCVTTHPKGTVAIRLSSLTRRGRIHVADVQVPGPDDADMAALTPTQRHRRLSRRKTASERYTSPPPRRAARHRNWCRGDLASRG